MAGGRWAVACVVRAGPSCSSICGDPGRLRRVRIRSRIATASIGCVNRLAKTQRPAACARSRCSAWPARSQSAGPSPWVTRTAVAAAGGPPAGSVPRPRSWSKSRCRSRPRWPLVGSGRLFVALQPGEQPVRQRPGVERAAMRVPVRQRLQHPPLGLGHRRLGAKPHPGEQPGRVGKKLDLGQVVQRAHRQAQPEQCGAAADDHLAADRVQPELAAGGRYRARSRTG